MKLLLDENLPKRLKTDFNDHEIFTVADLGWMGISNGKLLSLLVENGFDALLTFDKNLQFQQNFAKYSVAVIVLNAPDNSYSTLRNIVQGVKELLSTELKPGPVEVRLN